MKKIIISFLVVAFVLGLSGIAEAATRVKGYFRSNGSYVNSYYRTSPNKTKYDNYSTYGNYNPYTGKSGTKKYYFR